MAKIDAYHTGVAQLRHPTISYDGKNVIVDLGRGRGKITLTVEEVSEAWALIRAHSYRNDTLKGDEE